MDKWSSGPFQNGQTELGDLWTSEMGRPELLASGIGSALLTTAAGLFVAIPAYAAYAFFVARADKLTLEMDALVQNVIELVCAEAQGTSRGRRRKAA